MYALKSRARYIQLIHIGKAQLKLDDDSYRSVLVGCVDKDSCKDMSEKQLDKVLQRMKEMGFKIVRKRRASSKRGKVPSQNTGALLGKLRFLWAGMYSDGYLRDPSERALLQWSKAQVRRFNHNTEIENLSWLTPKMLHHLIEQLKQWHKRCGKKASNG